MSLVLDVGVRMNFRLLFVSLIIGLLLGPAASRAWADGGLLRLRERSGPYQISVFTAPTPMQTGIVDISVFVQDVATGESVPDVIVVVRLTLRVPGEKTKEYRASRESATNKLYQSALCPITEVGWWDVEVVVDGARGEGRGRFEMDAARPSARWVAMWPWFVWPVVPIGLFCLHAFIVRRRGRKHGLGRC